ncbi:MAG TPA: hypothetical protein VES20_04515, partial [Bryobacteraceae bacterium]|nr:hypothetical protein [Bryobacteraceae bacterium]
TAFTPTRPVFSAETETAPGRMTVVQGLHREFGIPAFLMEQRIARDPKLGRLPSVPERMVFGKALVHAIAEALCCGR